VPLSGVTKNRIESPDRQFPPRQRPPPLVPVQCGKPPSELRQRGPERPALINRISRPPHLIFLKLPRGSPQFLSQRLPMSQQRKRDPAEAGPLGLVFRRVQSGRCYFIVRWRSEPYPRIKFSCRFFSRVLLSLPKTVGAGYDALYSDRNKPALCSYFTPHVSAAGGLPPGASDLRSVNFGSGPQDMTTPGRLPDRLGAGPTFTLRSRDAERCRSAARDAPRRASYRK
jgi:hypothetical protein